MESASALEKKIRFPGFRHQDVLFGLGALAVVLMFVVPLPPVVLDVLLSLNLFIALVMLLSTIYLRSVLDLSTFPTLLLFSTILRLAVTISTTRAILAHADAGLIVRGFGEFVIAGNVVVGLVVFLIVSIVQFIVVTKGAERIAEVAARFTLDSLPGKQLSIDADMRSGELSQEAARKRRFQLERESQFFGAMDGSMRFIKGDAIASLVVVFVNLIGGLLIGVFSKGMGLAAAAHTFSILSVGDGLVAQIPAMFSAVASGVLVTRVVSEDQVGVGAEIGRQLTATPNALLVSSGGLFLIGMLPGFPFALMTVMAACVAIPVVIAHRKRIRETEVQKTARKVAEPSLEIASFNDPFVAHLSKSAFDQLSALGLRSKLEAKILGAANQIGLSIPVLKFRIDERIAADQIRLATDGIPQLTVSLPQPVTDIEPLAAQLVDFLVRSFPRTLCLDDAQDWLDHVRKRYSRLTEEVSQRAPMDLIVQLLRGLLSDGVPLAHSRALLELLAKAPLHELTYPHIEDLARLALKNQIQYQFVADGKERVLLVISSSDESGLRKIFAGAETLAQNSAFESQRLAIARQFMETATAITATKPNVRVIVAVAPDLRAGLRDLLREKGAELAVVSFAEIDNENGMDRRVEVTFDS